MRVSICCSNRSMSVVFMRLGSHLAADAATPPLNGYVRNIALNPRLDVSAHALALTTEQGSVAFYESAEAGNGGLGSLFQADNTVKRPVWVHAERGDALLERGVPAPDLIKIDVEGFELEVLRGLERTLIERRPRLVVESSGYRLSARGLAPDAVVRALCSLGYSVSVIDPRRHDGSTRPIEAHELRRNLDLAAVPA